MKRGQELQNKLVAFYVTGIAKGCNRDLLNKSTGYLVLCTVTAPKIESGQRLRREVADKPPFILLWRLMRKRSRISCLNVDDLVYGKVRTGKYSFSAKNHCIDVLIL